MCDACDRPYDRRRFLRHLAAGGALAATGVLWADAAGAAGRPVRGRSSSARSASPALAPTTPDGQPRPSARVVGRAPDHHPGGVGRRRVDPHVGPGLRPDPQARRAPHRVAQQSVEPAGRRARHVPVPRGRPGLRRPRVQLRDRPSRQHLRGSMGAELRPGRTPRRRGRGRLRGDGGPRRRGERRQLRRGADRRLLVPPADRRRRERAGPTAGVEGVAPPDRPVGLRDVHRPLRAGAQVPEHRRSSQRRVHRLSRQRPERQARRHPRLGEGAGRELRARPHRHVEGHPLQEPEPDHARQPPRQRRAARRAAEPVAQHDPQPSARPRPGRRAGAISLGTLLGVRVLSSGGNLTTLGKAQKFGSPVQRGNSGTIAISPGPQQSYWTIDERRERPGLRRRHRAGSPSRRPATPRRPSTWPPPVPAPGTGS